MATNRPEDRRKASFGEATKIALSFSLITIILGKIMIQT
jgi:hypothetical protein